MKENNKEVLNELKTIKKTVQHLLALELYKSGVKQTEIGKHLGISTAAANGLLKGVKVNKDKTS